MNIYSLFKLNSFLYQLAALILMVKLNLSLEAKSEKRR